MTGATTVLDTTWVSDLSGWVLVAAQCLNAPCRLVFHTSDGGRSWAKVAPPPVLVTANACDRCVDRLRFADPRIGYAYLDSQYDKQGILYVTTDGAHSWRQDSAPTIIEALEITGRTAARVVADGSGCPGPCGVRVESSRVGSSVWRRLPAPYASEGKGDGLVVEGSRIYYLGFGNPAGGVLATTRIARSLDAGATWRMFDDPCGSSPGAENDARGFAAAPGDFLAVLCSPRVSPAPPFVITSTDGGTTYGSPHPLPAPDALALAAGSARNLAAIILNGATQTVVVSHDGGADWRTTLTGPAVGNGPVGPDFFGFEDVQTGRAAFHAGVLWTTTNAGDSWQPFDFAGEAP